VKYLISLFLLTPILIFSQITEDLSGNIRPVKKKLYTKVLLQVGGGGKVLAGEKSYTVSDKDPEDIYIHPGGGTGLEAVIGYDINPSLSGELGIGFLQSGDQAGKDHIWFWKQTLRASVIYRLNISKGYFPYIGGGFSTNLSVSLDAETRSDELIIRYEIPTGFHILGGAEIKNPQSSWFMFGDFKFIFLGTYDIKEAKLNGNSIPISYVESDFREMNANGFQFALGFGYYLK